MKICLGWQGAQPGALWQPKQVGWGGDRVGRVKRKGTYIYLWLIRIDAWKKPTQYYKAIILQLKIKKKKHSGTATQPPTAPPRNKVTNWSKCSHTSNEGSLVSRPPTTAQAALSAWGSLCSFLRICPIFPSTCQGLRTLVFFSSTHRSPAQPGGCKNRTCHSALRGSWF